MTTPTTAPNETAQASGDAPADQKTPVAPTTTEVDEDQSNPDDEPDTSSRAGRDAAKYRQKMREAEAERDTVTAERDQLASQLADDRRAIIDWRAEQAKTDPALLDANGLDIAAMLDDSGRLDVAKVDAFITQTRARFNIGGFAPNRAQGHGGTPPPPPKPALSSAFKK
jgi:hypothetical protein